MKTCIELQNLQKKYNQFEAVKDISFQVEHGEFFALLGQNGAGKSTTVDILCTLLPKTSGEVLLNGHRLDSENDRIRKDIGIVFQKSLLDDRLTVAENIKLRGSFYQLSNQERKENYQFVSTHLELNDIQNKPYGKLSGGQRRRADIARALIHRPKILFLDEPTTGLDPQTRGFVWNTIKKLQKQNNMTVFLTTHYMDEAAVADHIVILDHGLIIAEGTPYELKKAHAHDLLKIVLRENISPKHILKNIIFEKKNNIYSIPVENTISGLQLVKKLEPHIAAFEMQQGTMDDVFINVLKNACPCLTK